MEVIVNIEGLDLRFNKPQLLRQLIHDYYRSLGYVIPEMPAPWTNNNSPVAADTTPEKK
jgi:hypothetical protein